MPTNRRLLGALVLVLGVLTAAVLWEVLGTVFFAVTLVYVAAPLYRALVDRGLRPWWASAVTTTLVFLGAVSLLAPFGVVLYQRRGDVVALLQSLPETATVGVGEFQFVVTTGDLIAPTVTLLRRVAISVAAQAPVLGVKLTVLAMVVFALLIRRQSASRALMAAVPWRHRPVVRRLNDRVRETLLAIYVMQAATALATFAVALPLFVLLDYRFALVLAVMAGLLQFLPIVGPSVVIAGLFAAEVVAGDVTGALLIGVIGWVLVALLPDVIVRPRLAERTAHVSGSLYFVGFTGGLLTVGAVGIILGPLVVVLLQEAVGMLAADTAVNPEGRLVEEGQER